MESIKDYRRRVETLYNQAKLSNDMVMLDSEAMVASSGKYTGRVPQYKRIVNNVSGIDWGKINKPMTQDEFDHLETIARRTIMMSPCHLTTGWIGDNEPSMYVKCYSLRPYHALFMTNMIRNLTPDMKMDPKLTFTIYNAGKYPAPKTESQQDGVCVALDLKNKKLIIFGSDYAGEMKKGIFTFAHYYYPLFHRALTLHSSCVVGPEPHNVTMFFGLSGTGKTTLSADSMFSLVGDDEHAWGENGVFNIEGGCYAKVLNLSAETEPEIYHAITFGSVFENVVHHQGIPDFADGSITSNTRLSYPLHSYPFVCQNSMVPHPRNIIFLTCDAFGVFPCLSRIPLELVESYFMTGYTSKMPGTEVGIKEPEIVYSACYSAPFLPLQPKVYAQMLKDKINKYGVQVWLINTGWFNGKRIPLSLTRDCVRAIVRNEVDGIKSVHIVSERPELSGLEVPIWFPESIFHHPELHTLNYNDQVEKVFKDWPFPFISELKEIS